MLSTEEVAKIKKYLEDGHRVGEIAEAYRISRQAVSKIAHGRTHAAVRPARSVPVLSKEAERIERGHQRAVQAANLLTMQSEHTKELEEVRRRASNEIWEAQTAARNAKRDADQAAEQVEQLQRELRAGKAKEKEGKTPVGAEAPPPPPTVTADPSRSPLIPEVPWTRHNHPPLEHVSTLLAKARDEQNRDAIDYFRDAERAVRTGPPMYLFPDGAGGYFPEPDAPAAEDGDYDGRQPA